MQEKNDAALEGSWALIAFDLDDTLAPSKSALPAQMGEALRALLDLVPVAVISGGAFTQFERQLLSGLGASKTQSANLHLLPTCGTRYLKYSNGNLREVYSRQLTSDQKKRAADALEWGAGELGLWETDPWGEIIEDRGSQVTFSALGQAAPLEEKRMWDPSGEKKAALVRMIEDGLPDLEVRSGGSTSVDITAAGVDKAYGMAALVKETGIAKERMLFIGDRLDPGGNDYAVKQAGWATYSVKGWEDTVQAIHRLVESLTRIKSGQGQSREG